MRHWIDQNARGSFAPYHEEYRHDGWPQKQPDQPKGFEALENSKQDERKRQPGGISNQKTDKMIGNENDDKTERERGTRGHHLRLSGEHERRDDKNRRGSKMASTTAQSRAGSKPESI